MKGGEGFQQGGACWGSWDGRGGDQGGAWVVRVGNAISLHHKYQVLKVPPSNDLTLKVGLWHFQLYQVPAGIDDNENMVDGGGELELLEGGAEK